jgi:hypothetical protein
MERPLSGLEAYLEWQERVKSFESSGLSVDAFFEQENVSRSQFVQWLLAVRGKPLEREEEARSAEGPAFVPVTVKAQFIEILLPGGGLVRLSDVVRLVSTVLQESQS